ncbi:MAG TPA: tryptophan 2,3-dioxygenase family protein [Acidimicrobiia bacterium]|nr:tryptophan 2,3-dioxygenase family protein [Acidimicrobiia bacterium]
MPGPPAEPLYYWDYLRLDQLLSAQEPRSAKGSQPAAHDELLFIVVHQAFELWFKQVLFELDAVLDVMGRDVVADKAMDEVVAHLRRIIAIQRLLVDQIDVLETMTPLDFLEFRDELIPASGFQSVQFRLIENKLGLAARHRLRIKGSPYTSVLSAEHVARLQASESEPSLHDHLARWLERTPFLSFGGFDFWSAYRDAVREMLERDRRVIETHPTLDEAGRNEQRSILGHTAAGFDAVFDAGRWAELVAQGKRRLPHRAFLAALLINLYREEPVFQLPFRLLTALVDIDENFTTWRQRHALLAHRMIGGRIGTGGTAGHEYLEAAVRRHRIFTDLFDLPTYFIPRSALPPLPAAVEEQMGFRYQ